MSSRTHTEKNKKFYQFELFLSGGRHFALNFAPKIDQNLSELTHLMTSPRHTQTCKTFNFFKNILHVYTSLNPLIKRLKLLSHNYPTSRSQGIYCSIKSSAQKGKTHNLRSIWFRGPYSTSSFLQIYVCLES